MSVEPIEYATGTRRDAWWRRHRRKLVVLVAVLTLATLGTRFREPIGRYVAWHYWHWELSRVESASATSQPTSRPAGLTCRPLDELVKLDPLLATMLDRGPVRRIGQAATATYDYVGQRRRPDGQWRTVVIRLEPEMYQPFNAGIVAVFARPSLLAGPPPGNSKWFGWATQRSGQWLPAWVSVWPDDSDARAVHVKLTLPPVESLNGDASRTRIPTELTGRLTNDDAIAWTLDCFDERIHGPDVATQPYARTEAGTRELEARWGSHRKR